MPKKGSVLKYIYGEKSVMTIFFIYADLESILEKINGCEMIQKNHQQLK